jgi:hypothetical protein
VTTALAVEAQTHLVVEINFVTCAQPSDTTVSTGTDRAVVEALVAEGESRRTGRMTAVVALAWFWAMKIHHCCSACEY